MIIRAAIAIALMWSVSILATPQRRTSPAPVKPPTLAERFPPPRGYSVEQDVESEGTRSFSTASDVRGHILRRFVQAGDDGPTRVPEIARYFAELLHAEGGVMFDDRLSNTGGRLDGRIPGARPTWLHVDINDSGSVLDIIALEEGAAAAREILNEETSIAGTWTNDGAPLQVAAVLSRAFSPYLGWAWQLSAHALSDGSRETVATTQSRLSLSGRQRSQSCASCPVVTDTTDVTVMSIDLNRLESIADRDATTIADDGFVIDPGFAVSSPVTRFRDGTRVLITGPGRPLLLVPATRGAYLQSQIRRALADRSASLDVLQTEFTALSPDGRNAPATDALGRRVLMLNPAYFEGGRDRRAPHFAVIDVPSKYGAGEVTLYQHDLIELLFNSPNLTDIVK